MNAALPLVRVETAGAVTTVTLNRPEKRNALCLALLEQLIAAIAAADAEPAQRILILAGKGVTFCAGLDLKEAAQATGARRSAALIAQALRSLSATRLVTIAAVQGAAVAGGAGLMSACDFAVAAEQTRIGYPEVRRGLVAGLVMTFLRRQLRERDARELLLTGELIDARRAAAIGLINRVVPPADLMKAAQRYADLVLQGGPEAVAHTKKLWGKLWPHAVADDLKRALAFHLRARHSAEAKEGIAAFREKREPRWSALSPTRLPSDRGQRRSTR